MKDYLSARKTAREEEMVFRGFMSRNWLSELRKCATDGTFHPHRKGKKRGGERQVEVAIITFLRIILTYSQE